MMGKCVDSTSWNLRRQKSTNQCSHRVHHHRKPQVKGGSKHILMSGGCDTCQTNLPIFKLKESCVQRRYSDFEWLRAELERESKVVVPPLPGKALFRQFPFRGDDGIFEENFIEERRQGLEQFLNKVAGHPLAQNERCLHMFLQDKVLDKNYTPSKIRQA
uniref:Sorting nexin 3 n=1 Tax=Takifugu rubripes TaxID=31033 RepID=A0A3B5K974_TAKRU